MGRVTRWSISPSPADAAREQQIAMAGEVPLVAWWETVGGQRRARVAAWTGQKWVIEQTIDSAGFYDSPSLVAGQSGEAYLSWAELVGVEGSRLLAARRSSSGTWSAPTVFVRPSVRFQGLHGWRRTPTEC
jgi:hypothetical protein